jgi:kynureninase
MNVEFTASYAAALDAADNLKHFREKFYIPFIGEKEAVYFLGNSLGLQPKTTQNEVLNVMEAWANFGVEGFFMGEEPWLNYHKDMLPLLANIVGANASEVVIMNHLTVNLHLLMVSFYRPTAQRYKIICEAKAFPSDQYAFKSQIKMHGLQVSDCLIEVQPQAGKETIDEADILACIEEHKNELALVLFSGVNYYTGQVFNIEKITAAAHSAGAFAGFDLAHAAGNIELKLNNWNVDFACWCNYKYLNSGPGAIAGAFVHQNHCDNKNITRLEGWWGNDEKNRFTMGENFTATATAESWQMSTAPVMMLAAHKASLNIFAEAGFDNLLQKAKQLKKYSYALLQLVQQQTNAFDIITPENETERGCQISLSVHKNAKQIFEQLLPNGIFADWREPNVIRFAPVPMYNSFNDIYLFASVFNKLLSEHNV